MRDWLKRWQEMTGWLPLVAVLAVLGWVVLGASAGRDDLIRWLLELPILAGYALSACGLTYLAWRRWSFRMTNTEQAEYRAALLRGDRAAQLIYVVNAIWFALVLFAFLAFFWPAR